MKAEKTQTKNAKEEKIEMKVVDPNGKTVETLPLDGVIVKSDTHPHLLYQSAVIYQANQRMGTAATKMRGEVSGGGKKPWRQKGTGRARHGSTRSPLWRKGGKTFGPDGRIYEREMPRRMKIQALIAGLKRKARDGKVLLVDDFVSKDGKTKEAAQWVQKLALRKPLIIRDAHDPLVVRSVRNLKHVSLKTSDHVAAYDVLASEECVLTKKGYARLVERLKNAQN